MISSTPDSKSHKYTEDNISDGEISDTGLEIVIESPNPKRKMKTFNILPGEVEIIKSVEKEIEETLDEKAAKSNLTANNVKNILKHVVTNEHVLAMVKHAENPDDTEPMSVFEPKLTRAKAKQLFSSQPVVNLPWITPKPPSEVHVLISDELQEDSSGDEYVPAEEESEDDREGSIVSDSDPSFLQPPTPTNCDSSTQTNWSEDGVFKVPLSKTKEEEEEEANIARRTRSKLSLSSTPLEVIEEAFIPPDITTDMYDLDCDDDDWKDFLKKFTRPLDEVTKHAEDEEHDPEYNVLADEEIDKVDKEELRADKAVKVTRKELNELIAELFEYADFYSSNLSQNKTVLENETEISVLEPINDSMQPAEKEPPSRQTREETDSNINEQTESSVMISHDQLVLLRQQLCQHVQLLTQTFILTYEHPEFAKHATACKENLLNFKYLSCDKTTSVYNTVNLKSSLKLVEEWEKKFATNDNEVKETKAFVMEVACKVKERKLAGLEYIPTFPKLVFETVLKSTAFVYPNLLPKIPCKPASTVMNDKNYLNSEDELIALGLEQFIPYLQKDAHNLTVKKQVNLKTLTHFLVKYLLVTRHPQRLYRHIIDMKTRRYEMNPIKYYFEHKKAPTTVHYVVSLEYDQIKAPREQNLEVLPYQWQEYLRPGCSSVKPPRVTDSSFVLTRTPVIPVIVDKPKKPILPNSPIICSTPKTSLPRPRRRPARPRLSINHRCKQKLESFFKSPSQQKLVNIISKSKLNNFKFNSSIFRRLPKRKVNVMFPNMPTINVGPPPKSGDNAGQERNEEAPDVTPPVEVTDKTPLATENASKTPSLLDGNKNIEKDNPEDINAFMVASSTMKSTSKREPSGAEKKRAKLRKEFTANLTMLSPEDPAIMREKINSYVQAYYDKVRETLDIDDYHKFMEVLNNHNEKIDKTTQLYKQVEAIFLPKYPDLADEFLTFLTPTDAKAVGKLVPHFMLTRMSVFLRKLEIYFKDQPVQVRKIYQSLTELSTCVNVTMENIKKTILPLLKGNALLTDWFLQIFPCEKPPDNTLLNGAWENIKIPHSINDFKDDGYETVVVPDMEDPFGGPNCVCTCHNVDDEPFKLRTRHCISCGTHFYQGRVYLQTGKLLRLAEVTFNEGTKSEHLERLNYKSKSRKKTLESTTKPSPSKDETRANNESEEDGECKKKQKKSRTPQRSRVKVRDKSTKTEGKKRRASTLEKVKKVEQTMEQAVKKPEKTKHPESKVEQQDRTKVDEQPEKIEHQQQNNTELQEIDNRVEQKPEAETMEWDCKHQSPEQTADVEADSGSEFCEESSQDNIPSESDASNEDSGSLSNSPPHSENSNSNIFDEMSWMRDEDKVILETFQREPDKDTAFKCIAELLENRTVSQISQRFQTLMNLLQQMVANCND